MISVVIPTHNYGRFLREAIESVRAQTGVDLEIVVVDDGSTDDTQEVLASIRDDRLRVITQPQSGPAGARNRGIAEARGDYVAFLDADDRWRPGKLARQLQVLESEPGVGFVFTDLVRFDASGFIPGTQFHFVPELDRLPPRPSHAGDAEVILADTFLTLAATRQFATWLPTVLVRRSAIRGIEFPDQRNCQDYGFMLRLYARARAAFVRTPLVEVRRHGSNSYAAEHDTLLPALHALENLPLEDLSSQQHQVWARKMAQTWCTLGYHYLHVGDFRGSARAYRTALRYPGRRLHAARHLMTLPLRAAIASVRALSAAPDVRRESTG